MDCKKIKEEIVFRVVDEELGQELLVAFQSHVAQCPECARQAKTTERMLMIVRQRAFRLPAPHHLRNRILAEMRHQRENLR